MMWNSVSWILFVMLHQVGNLIPLLERKHAQVLFDVAIVGVYPKVVERHWCGEPFVEPERLPFTFPELGARRRRDERGGEAMRFLSFAFPDEFDAGGDVAPLVAPAHLHLAMLCSEQVPEIVSLRQHV